MKRLASQIQIDFRSAEPIFSQIARQVQALVQNGELKPGDQLPTVRELAAELRINFTTVARAYHILDEAHLISTQRGRGTYIWDSPPQAEVQRPTLLQGLAHRYWEEASRLGFSAQEARQALDAVLGQGSRAAETGS